MTDRSNTAHKPEQFVVERDPRADGGKRQVRVTRNGVMIARRLGGISMMIAVPVAAYRGVALAVQAATNGAAAYKLSLAHPDPDLDVVLAETCDSSAAAADWRYWSSYLDLPRLAGGAAERDDLGGAQGLAGRAPLRRRRNASVLKRRPRFLGRRRLGDAARLDAVFRDEREIVCYE
jgi:hypothetical protein